MSSREVHITIWADDHDEPELEFTYTEGDAAEMDFEEWRATQLDGFLKGLNSIAEEHDLFLMETVRP